MTEIAYICDRRKPECRKGNCIGSRPGGCYLTTDIRHARNFKEVGDGKYAEKGGGMKALIGKTEQITFDEASDIADKMKTEYLYYLTNLVKDTVKDMEERSNVLVNLSTKLGNLIGAYELKGILTDPDEYIAQLPYNEGVRIDEID